MIVNLRWLAAMTLLALAFSPPTWATDETASVRIVGNQAILTLTQLSQDKTYKLDIITIPQGTFLFHWDTQANVDRYARQGTVDDSEVEYLREQTGAKTAFGGGFYVSKDSFDSSAFGTNLAAIVTTEDIRVVKGVGMIWDPATTKALRDAGLDGIVCTDTWLNFVNGRPFHQVRAASLDDVLGHWSGMSAAGLGSIGAKFPLMPDPIIAQKFPEIQKLLQGIPPSESFYSSNDFRGFVSGLINARPVNPDNLALRNLKKLVPQEKLLPALVPIPIPFSLPTDVPTGQIPVTQLMSLESVIPLRPTEQLKSLAPETYAVLTGNPLTPAQKKNVITQVFQFMAYNYPPGRLMDRFQTALHDDLVVKLRQELLPLIEAHQNGQTTPVYDSQIQQDLQSAQNWGISLNELLPDEEPSVRLRSRSGAYDLPPTPTQDFGQKLLQAMSFIDNPDLAKAMAYNHGAPWTLYDEPGKMSLLERWKKATDNTKPLDLKGIYAIMLEKPDFDFRGNRVIAGGDLRIPGIDGGFYLINEHEKLILEKNPFLTLEIHPNTVFPTQEKTYLVRHEYPSAFTYKKVSGFLSPDLVAKLKEAEAKGVLQHADSSEFADLTRQMITELVKKFNGTDLQAYQNLMSIHPSWDDNGRTLRANFLRSTQTPFYLPIFDDDLFYSYPELVAAQAAGAEKLRLMAEAIIDAETKNPGFPRYYDSPDLWSVLVDLPMRPYPGIDFTQQFKDHYKTPDNELYTREKRYLERSEIDQNQYLDWIFGIPDAKLRQNVLFAYTKQTPKLLTIDQGHFARFFQTIPDLLSATHGLDHERLLQWIARSINGAPERFQSAIAQAYPKLVPEDRARLIYECLRWHYSFGEKDALLPIVRQDLRALQKSGSAFARKADIRMKLAELAGLDPREALKRFRKMRKTIPLTELPDWESELADLTRVHSDPQGSTYARLGLEFYLSHVTSGEDLRDALPNRVQRLKQDLQTLTARLAAVRDADLIRPLLQSLSIAIAPPNDGVAHPGAGLDPSTELPYRKQSEILTRLAQRRFKHRTDPDLAGLWYVLQKKLNLDKPNALLEDFKSFLDKKEWDSFLLIAEQLIPNYPSSEEKLILLQGLDAIASGSDSAFQLKMADIESRTNAVTNLGIDVFSRHLGAILDHTHSATVAIQAASGMQTSTALYRDHPEIRQKVVDNIPANQRVNQVEKLIQGPVGIDGTPVTRTIITDLIRATPKEDRVVLLRKQLQAAEDASRPLSGGEAYLADFAFDRLSPEDRYRVFRDHFQGSQNGVSLVNSMNFNKGVFFSMLEKYLADVARAPEQKDLRIDALLKQMPEFAHLPRGTLDANYVGVLSKIGMGEIEDLFRKDSPYRLPPGGAATAIHDFSKNFSASYNTYEVERDLITAATRILQDPQFDLAHYDAEETLRALQEFPFSNAYSLMPILPVITSPRLSENPYLMATFLDTIDRSQAAAIGFIDPYLKPYADFSLAKHPDAAVTWPARLRILKQVSKIPDDQLTKVADLLSAPAVEIRDLASQILAKKTLSDKIKDLVNRKLRARAAKGLGAASADELALAKASGYPGDFAIEAQRAPATGYIPSPCRINFVKYVKEALARISSL